MCRLSFKTNFFDRATLIFMRFHSGNVFGSDSFKNCMLRLHEAHPHAHTNQYHSTYNWSCRKHSQWLIQIWKSIQIERSTAPRDYHYFRLFFFSSFLAFITKHVRIAFTESPMQLNQFHGNLFRFSFASAFSVCNFSMPQIQRVSFSHSLNRLIWKCVGI